MNRHPRSAPRRRDRHGRGMRGPLAPPEVPIALTRAEVFEDLVRESAERLRARWGEELDGVEFAVQDVPWPADFPENAEVDGVVPLARLVPGEDGGPSRIVVFRRPVELRATVRGDRAALVHDLVVEQVADLLGVSPDSVDPRYGEG